MRFTVRMNFWCIVYRPNLLTNISIALYSATCSRGHRFRSNKEFWDCARNVFLGFRRDNRFNFAECSAPRGLATDFLHDVRARNAFREIDSRMKSEALLGKFHFELEKIVLSAWFLTIHF